jgi:NTP pyrophosphatase (non-canonical NTP hydrolase)
MSEQMEFPFMNNNSAEDDMFLLNKAIATEFSWSMDYMQKEFHANACRKGFWSSLAYHTVDDLFPQNIALVHSEISEALEAHRNREGKERIAEELADAVIRIMDLAYASNISLAQAIVDKHNKNLNRSHMHGNKAY